MRRLLIQSPKRKHTCTCIDIRYVRACFFMCVLCGFGCRCMSQLSDLTVAAFSKDDNFFSASTDMICLPFLQVFLFFAPPLCSCNLVSVPFVLIVFSLYTLFLKAAVQMKLLLLCYKWLYCVDVTTLQ